MLVNAADAIDGYYPLHLQSLGLAGEIYALLGDVLSAMVLIAVIALVLRRFALPSRKDFSFNQRTLLHEDLRENYVVRDSLIVSLFILFHVGSRRHRDGLRAGDEGAGSLSAIRHISFACILPATC